MQFLLLNLDLRQLVLGAVDGDGVALRTVLRDLVTSHVEGVFIVGVETFSHGESLDQGSVLAHRRQHQL